MSGAFEINLKALSLLALLVGVFVVFQTLSFLALQRRRTVLMRAAEIYQGQYADAEGRIPATFEIICLTGWAAHDSQQKPLRPGSAAARLADALNAAEQPLPRQKG